MAARPRVPDAFLHASLWLGIGAAVILFGYGFAVKAGDGSPWPWWLASPGPLLPFALLYWLARSGRVELLDTEDFEAHGARRAVIAAYPRLPRSWRRTVIVALIVGGFVLEKALDYLENNSPAFGDRLAGFTDRFPHPEYGAWLLVVVGIVGAIYETVAVIRGGRPS